MNVKMEAPGSTGKSFMLNRYFSEIERVWKGSLEDIASCMSNGHDVVYGSTRWKPPRLLPKYLWNSSSSSNLSMYSQLEDLIHLPGPLTEDVIIRTLQARFYTKQYYTNIGCILLSLNPFTHKPKSKALSLDEKPDKLLKNVVKSAVVQLSETGCNQAIVLNGLSGSGKTHQSKLILRQLFDVAGGGSVTDSYKHLCSAMTVLQSLGSAATINNPHSSRMGHYIENHLTDGAIYKTKIHCYLLDHSRVVSLQPNERNFQIFYHVLTGLTQEERGKYHLQGYHIGNLNYLKAGGPIDDEDDFFSRQCFTDWKAALSVLGIPLSDVMRVVAAILLLGNVQFVDGPGLELEVLGNNEIKAISALLGISGVTLYRSLTMRSQQARGQVFKTVVDAASANHARDQLAQALYSRTVSAVVKRCNSSKRPTFNSTASSSSNDSNNESQHSPNHGNGKSKISRSSSISQSLVSRPGVDGSIGILDMFGFEKLKENRLEQLCINLCEETLQHFYNTHVFKSTEESCIEEGIQSDMDISYFENAPIVELISSQRTGILSLLDAESSMQRSNLDTYLQKIRIQHKMNKHFEESSKNTGWAFAIHHFAGKVDYDVSMFMTTNRELIPDDVVWMFSKQNCNFGFVNHLFAHEIKTMQDEGSKPKGVSFRIGVGSTPSNNPGSGGLGTYSLDFHNRLDGLLKTIVQARPHFIRCIKCNSKNKSEEFEREEVIKQVRHYQVLETLHLMAAGFPHRMRYRIFNSRYRLLLKGEKVPNRDDKSFTESKLILEKFLEAMDESSLPYASAHWALGKKHIFLSESARQQLEVYRDAMRKRAATIIQCTWRGVVCRARWPTLRRQLSTYRRRSTGSVSKQRSQRNNSSSFSDDSGLPNQSSINETSTGSIYGLDMSKTPSMPSRRSYTVQGNIKMGYPHFRVMRQNYADGKVVLLQGQEVKVVGVSSRQGFLMVNHASGVINVPYQLMEIKQNLSRPQVADV